MQAREERELDRREERKEGLETGLKQGRGEGVAVLLKTYRKLGLSMENAQSELETEFNLTAEEAQTYLDKHWEKE